MEFESKRRFPRNCIKFQNFCWFCVLYNCVFISYCEKKKKKKKKKKPFMFSVIHNSSTYLWNQVIVLVPSSRSCCPTVGCGDCNPWEKWHQVVFEGDAKACFNPLSNPALIPDWTISTYIYNIRLCLCLSLLFFSVRC